MKVLVITHSGNLTYGAAKSLQLLLSNSSFSFDIVFNKPMLKTYTTEELKQYAGERCEKVYFFNLPFYSEIMENYHFFRKDKTFFHNCIDNIKSFGRKVLFRLDNKKIKKIIDREEYDYIYLNSSVLYPIINNNKKTIIHVRELLKTNINKRIVNKFSLAHHLICIDYATQQHVLKWGNSKINTSITVVTNPFDMRGVREVRVEMACKKYNIDKERTVFLMAGVISEEKGVDFVVDCFKTESLQDSVLIVAGRLDDLAKSLMQNKTDNIIFTGEIEDMTEIYSVTDCLIRGENEFCTGRTVYEALYSGCQVLIPGRKSDLTKQEFELDQIDRVFVYEPRNKTDFIKQIKKVKKNLNQDFKDNNLDVFSKKIDDIFQ